jgi:hypothetical protein
MKWDGFLTRRAKVADEDPQTFPRVTNPSHFARESREVPCIMG